ncbi:30S ribosomal protein S6 [Candidatus Microgenomates bacterium]|nr:30S ribosomal protein S6 [Candidatus Microgenomates bacterium]
MQQYELVILTQDSQGDSILEHVKKLIGGFQGTVDEVVEWGTKDLTYPIKKQSAASFFVVKLTLSPTHSSQLSHELRLEEHVLRHLLVKRIAQKTPETVQESKQKSDKDEEKKASTAEAKPKRETKKAKTPVKKKRG